MNKYELLKDDTLKIGNYTLYRIKALKDFSDVKAGNLGGYVENYTNLSQDNNCWIYDNAKVYSNARVFRNAKVYNNAGIFGNAIIYGNAKVLDSAEIFGNAEICDTARVFGNAKVYGNPIVCNNAKVFGNAEIFGSASIKRNAYIKDSFDHMCIGPIGSRKRYTTFYLDINRNINVVCGCFTGTLDKFKKAVEETHKDNELYRDQYLFAIECAVRFFLAELKGEYNDKCMDALAYIEMYKI